MKTVNLLGDTQREQWHSVVNMLRQLGGDLTYEGRSGLCDELDRYIDAMEDANEQSEPNTVYALVCTEYCNSDIATEVKLFSDPADAWEEMHSQYKEQLELWNFDMSIQDGFHYCICEDNNSRIEDYSDFVVWKIEVKEVCNE